MDVLVVQGGSYLDELVFLRVDLHLGGVPTIQIHHHSALGAVAERETSPLHSEDHERVVPVDFFPLVDVGLVEGDIV